MEKKNPFINTLRSYMHRFKRARMKAPLDVMKKKMRGKKKPTKMEKEKSK